MPSRPFGGSENSVFLKVKSALEASNEGLESNFMAKKFQFQHTIFVFKQQRCDSFGNSWQGVKDWEWESLCPLPNQRCQSPFTLFQNQGHLIVTNNDSPM